MNSDKLKSPLGIIGIIVLVIFICLFLCVCCVLSGNLLPQFPTRTATYGASAAQNGTPLASPTLAEETATLSPTPLPTETPLPFTPTITSTQVSTSTHTRTVTSTIRPTSTITRTVTRAVTSTSAAVAATSIPATSSACIAAYPDFCITRPRLTCDELGVNNFTVLPPDPLGYDRDNDGLGCEG